MSFLRSILLSGVGRAAARRFEAATRDPAAAQRRKLLEIAGRNRDSEYGREYGFREVRSLADWQRLVPVVKYEDIQERVERVTRGEKNVLTAEDPVMFARTSGTTGDAKYIPVTPTCWGRDHTDQMRTWLYWARREHRDLYRKVLSLVSPAVEGRTPCGIPYGSTSGHIYKNLPAIIRGVYAVPYEVFEIEDYEAKYYALMRLGIAADISFVCTANPSSIVKMCELADKNADALLRDLADGTLSRDLAIEPRIRAVIEARCRPERGRARDLEGARKRRGGKLLPADYWRRLALIGCWKGGTVGNYIEQFPDWFHPGGEPPVPVRDWGYLSSEARGSIPLSDEGSAGPLTVATNVYEFVEVEDLEEDPDDPGAWTFHGVDSLELGKEYYIFITTTGGLYRYDINDVVQVVGEYHRTPAIIFRRKGRGMTSITGEKMSVNQVIQAVEAASHEVGLQVSHFKAEADFKGSRYVLKVEPDGEVPPGQGRRLLAALEGKLTELNLEYESKRRSLRLKPPVLHLMRPGWYDWRKERLAAGGKRVFQAKTVLLSPFDEERWEDEKQFLTRTVKLGQEGGDERETTRAGPRSTRGPSRAAGGDRGSPRS
jgi:hypothetical protein